MPFVDTARLRVHYRTHGDPQGLPLLCVHGSHASSHWWEPFFAVLPDEIWAIAPDLRGCGQSEHRVDGYDMPAQAADLQAFVEALDLREIDLVGHSTGAAIAIEFALTQADRLSTLTLISPPSTEGVFTPLDVFTLLDQMQTDRDLHAQAIAAMMPGLIAHPEAASERLFAELVDEAQTMAPAAFSAHATALGRWQRFDALAGLTLPTLLVWGDQDTLVNRDDVTRTFIAIPGANNLDVLRNVGHSPMLEAPLVLAERIVEFITDDYREYAAIRSSVDDE